MVDNEHLKCTATLPLYITSESAVSRTIFSALFKIQVKIPFLTLLKNLIFRFSCSSTREDLSIYVSITNVGLILTKLR